MPASLLIYNRNQIGEPLPGTYLFGEIVEVERFGFDWGPRREEYFAIFDITDKKVAEVKRYEDNYNRLIDMTVIEGPGPGGGRTINVRNNAVNTSGTLGNWTAENTQNIIDEWTLRYPQSELATVQIFTNKNPDDVWQCQGKFIAGQYEEFEQTIIGFGLGDTVKRRVWQVTPAGMDLINEQPNAHWSGTASQFSQIVQDARET